MNTVFIYALNEPDTGRTRYIGKASDPYARYEEHLNQNPWQRTYKASWIRSLLSAGQNPILEVLDEVPENEWQLWEREWIRLYRALGFRLTNGTEGGEGLVATAEVRAKISASHLHRIYKGGWRHSPAIIAKMSDAKLGKKKSPETRAKMSAAKKGTIHTIESRANMASAQKRRRERERIQNGV